MISEEELDKWHEELERDRIEKARQRRKGYERFCDMISTMNDNELKEFAMQLPKKLGKENLSPEEKSRIYGEISRVVDEVRMRRTGNTYFSKNTDTRWYQDCGFVISYGEKGDLIPIGDIVRFKQLELINNSSEIEQYEELSEEDKRKTLEAVFSDERGSLKLRIPVGSLMELKDILDEYARINSEKHGKEVNRLLAEENGFESTIVALGISLNQIEGTIESIDTKSESDSKLLGTNYSVCPFNLERYKEPREKIREIEDDELER